MSRFEAAAICTPGLEAVCEQELRALGIKPKPGAHGVVEFWATPRQLYSANVWLRTAARVLIRIAKFRATDFAHLQARAAEVDWASWIADDYAPQFRVTAHKSALYHTDAIAQRLHQVVGPPSIGEPEQPFIIRFDHDVATVSVDSSGIPLHRRGWRVDIGVAPLRPTMASALLLAAGYDGTVPLADPFCGSGTIAIEAALIAKNMPPGGERRFAFQTWSDFDTGSWASVNGGAKSQAREVDFVIEASDRDTAAVDAARANAERAGVADIVKVEQRVVAHMTGATGPGLVASNPPYGKRVGDGDLNPLYKRFGAVVRERRPEWGLAVVASDPRLARRADSRLKPLTALGHGGIRVEFLARDADPADLELAKNAVSTPESDVDETSDAVVEATSDAVVEATGDAVVETGESAGPDE